MSSLVNRLYRVGRKIGREIMGSADRVGRGNCIFGLPLLYKSLICWRYLITLSRAPLS
jgi:hypothetical protein